MAHFTWRLTLGITLPNRGQSTTVSKSRLAAHLKNSASSWRVERGLAGSFCKEGDFSSAKAQFHPSTWSGGRSGISCNEATLCSKGGFVTYRIRGFSSRILFKKKKLGLISTRLLIRTCRNVMPRSVRA